MHNAGLTDDCKLVHTKDMLEYERTFNVNVKVCHGLGIAFFLTPQSDQLMA